MAVVAGVLVVGGWLVHDGGHERHPPVPARAQAFASPAPDTGSAVVSVPAPSLPRSVPVRLRIPAISVDAPVDGVGLDQAGHLEAPPAAGRNLVGWYRDGASPGETGNAVMAGHVDTSGGPAVFWNLGTLRKGDEVQVRRDDGRIAVFTVDATEVYPKTAFPDAKVYGPTSRSELRLVTCGGGFSEKSGYRGNVVAYAHLTTTK